MTIYRILPALLACLIISACGSLVYKQDIQQGNVLDSKDVSRLEPGMTKRQVRVLLGTPSISSPFHEERWDYMNTLAKRGGKTRKRILTLYFDDDALQSIEGSYLDEADIAGEALDELRKSGDTPVQDLDSLRDDDRSRGTPGN